MAILVNGPVGEAEFFPVRDGKVFNSLKLSDIVPSSPADVPGEGLYSMTITKEDRRQAKETADSFATVIEMLVQTQHFKAMAKLNRYIMRGLKYARPKIRGRVNARKLNKRGIGLVRRSRFIWVTQHGKRISPKYSDPFSEKHILNGGS